ncbi:SGNH/GDSL hydrolase family protein [Cellulophaga lytica]|uniref:Carbohydrate esterase family 2 domain protein n=1 Tax=Cellulophaga lytica (strain ATCC 23178 / DSM 7489 / JCM 8516 / NBRC 14961 / NCIMB 1423 / VKM B-1433 / Cy l20) TaxID=867900 RepID=F0RD38_CELLC|nr:SGNH/GDSL hydrolase family protein [Cellulophaga lytica]ADY29739.1 carbohydrate esterase family 2 domain protein [Cellulophaga lytica DSM 7489]APU10613.1 electron transporter RnfD [Cellulophaga lytica]WQG76091.1 SGNH/GDSL hydrolase family protein [Cellulophaga lytica]
MKFSFYVLILSIVVLTSCKSTTKTIITNTNKDITYWGRVNSNTTDSTDLHWSGTSIKLNFEGTSIQALLQDEKGENYYNVLVDNDSAKLLRLDTTKRYYTLASNLKKGKHTVELFKRTEWDKGKTSFFGFKLNKQGKILPKDAPKARKIEFYGNSITAGYAVEDFTGKDRPDSTYTNNYLSYAALTARHFNAEYRAICKSGIGVTVSWFPIIMPELYNRLDPNNQNSVWDFSLYQPDVVVVNLFQNDSWIVNMPKNEEFKHRFGYKKPEDDFFITAYQNFITSLRKEYPKAKIICALGAMDATKENSKWMNFISKAAAKIADKNVYTHFMPYKNTPGHPSINEQKEMAKSLIAFIDKNINW